MTNAPNSSTEPASTKPEEQAKREAAAAPSRDDVHEQREPDQQQEGVVHRGTRPPAQTAHDLDRASGEGMAPLRESDEDIGVPAPGPTPGPNALAGKKK